MLISTLAAHAAPAGAPTLSRPVMLVGGREFEDARGREMLTRLRAELRAAGFRVIETDGLVRARPTAGERPFALVILVRQGDAFGVDVALPGEDARQAVSARRVVVGGAQTAVEPAALAIRTVEVLQAYERGPASEVEARVPVPTQTFAVSSRPAHWGFGMGAAALYGPAALGMGLSPQVNVERVLDPDGFAGTWAWDLTARAAGPGFGQGLASDVARADVQQWLGLLALGLRARADAAWQVRLSATTGVHHLRADVPPDPRLLVTFGQATTVVAGGGVSVILHLRGISLHAGVDALFAPLSRVNVNVGNRGPVALLSPLWLVSLGAMVHP